MRDCLSLSLCRDPSRLSLSLSRPLSPVSLSRRDPSRLSLSLCRDRPVAALHRLPPHDQEPVVYVGYPFLVEGLEASNEEFKKRAVGCQGLHKDWTAYGALWSPDLIDLVQPTMPRVALLADKRSLVLAGAAATVAATPAAGAATLRR